MEKMPSSFNRQPDSQLEQAQSRVQTYLDNFELYDDIMNGEEIARKSGYLSHEDYARDSYLLHQLQTGEITEEEAKQKRAENIEEAKEERKSTEYKRQYFSKKAGRASLSNMSRMLNDVADAKHRELDKMRKDLAKEEAAEQEDTDQAEEPKNEDTEQ